MAKKRTKTHSVKKEAFLAAYAVCGTITHAANEAGVSRFTHYDWLEKDPEYPERFAAAHAEACDALEKEARRRAVDGWEEPVFYEGKPCGSKRRYSDAMLAMLLNGSLPHKYRNRVEHSGPNGGPIKTQSVMIYLPNNNRQELPNSSVNGNGHHTSNGSN